MQEKQAGDIPFRGIASEVIESLPEEDRSKAFLPALAEAAVGHGSAFVVYTDKARFIRSVQRRMETPDEEPWVDEIWDKLIEAKSPHLFVFFEAMGCFAPSSST